MSTRQPRIILTASKMKSAYGCYFTAFNNEHMLRSKEEKLCLHCLEA